MSDRFYQMLIQKSFQNATLSKQVCRQILRSSRLDLLKLIQAAFVVRQRYWKKDVTIHIINNVQNGSCSEDCQYCAQSRFSKAPIAIYPMKSDQEILEEARLAYRSGAFRYCMVFSGREQGDQRIHRLVGIIRKIKRRFHLEVCVSCGFITPAQALILKKAGLNRLNHNINTSERFYKQICSTHDFQARLETLHAAQSAQLEICSGVIVGMGETVEDVIDAAFVLRQHKKVKSIPVNFFLPIKGTSVSRKTQLTPEYCLRVLCLYRFLHPRAEIRIAAGREYHLRDLQILGLYAASSIFMDGYLNVRGASRLKTLQMIKDAGFRIRSDRDLDDLIAKEKECGQIQSENDRLTFKHKDGLHRFCSKETAL
ncbi:MAG TPA: biotin synthase BioB [Candidatus Omnitrophota bacterium]|nr:biotin synthase BioB [Candidatus Omnitrophota bacterium]HQL41569.1 biotin synthase BioB [Candidatus Omnitrophota bacterium]